MNPEIELLRLYAEKRDEAAFAEIVRRHLRLVYATALRLANGDAALAQDVTQTVFTDLARKAASLAGQATLAGWLHTSARFAAAKAVRAEQCRRTHEQEAATMHDATNPEDIAWAQMRPWLDEAVGRLNEGERDAVVLRFFAEKSHREVGEVLGLNENAARMRVERGLEKLRGYFERRGVKTSAALLTSMLGVHAVEGAIPAGLEASVAGNSLAGAAKLGPAGNAAGGTWAMATKGLAAMGIALAAAGIWAWVQWRAPNPAPQPARVAQVAPSSPAPQPVPAANVTPPSMDAVAPVTAMSLISNTTGNTSQLSITGNFSAATMIYTLAPHPARTAAGANTTSVTTPAAGAAASPRQPAPAARSNPPMVYNATTTAGPSSARVPISYKGWTSVAVGKMSAVRGVFWLEGNFFVMGVGPILSSPDGLMWTEHKNPANCLLYSITKYGNLYVVVGVNGVIMTSRDLDNWTRVDTGTTDRFYSVYWTGTQFAALGNEGKVATSPDGVKWTVSQPPSANESWFHGGIWTGERFVVTDHDGILTSPNGEEWAKVQNSPAYMLGVAWSGDTYVALGGNDTYWSADGLQWNEEGAEATREGHSAVIWTGWEFLAAGSDGAVDSSIDGETWQNHPVDNGVPLVALAEHNGIVVAGAVHGEVFTNYLHGWQVSPEGVLVVRPKKGDVLAKSKAPAKEPGDADVTNDTAPDDNTTVSEDNPDRARAPNRTTDTASPPPSARVPISYDGWASVAVGKMQKVQDVEWLGDQFVVVGEGPVLSSPDGMHWTAHPIPDGSSLHSIARYGNLSVAVGEKGEIITSPDLNTWTQVFTGTKDRFYSVYWANRQFVALGENGRVATSPDGVKWIIAQEPSAYRADFQGGVWSGERLVVANREGIMISPDGHDWQRNQITPASLRDVAWNGHEFVALGGNATSVSYDGIHWVDVSAVTKDLGHGSVRWTGWEFVAVGTGGAVDSSSDGLVWQKHSVGKDVMLQAVAEHLGVLVVGSESGELLTNYLSGWAVSPEGILVVGATGGEGLTKPTATSKNNQTDEPQ